LIPERFLEWGAQLCLRALSSGTLAMFVWFADDDELAATCQSIRQMIPSIMIIDGVWE